MADPKERVEFWKGVATDAMYRANHAHDLVVVGRQQNHRIHALKMVRYWTAKAARSAPAVPGGEEKSNG